MAARALHEPLRVFRIGDPKGEYPIYSGEGAAAIEGRWHSKAQETIYASVHYSTAMLEKLAHYNGVLPPGQHFIEIEIPAGSSYEVVTKDTLPEWNLATVRRPARTDRGGSRRSDRSSCWCRAMSRAKSKTSSSNPHHPEFARLRPSLERPVWWDKRLFERNQN